MNNEQEGERLKLVTEAVKCEEVGKSMSISRCWAKEARGRTGKLLRHSEDRFPSGKSGALPTVLFAPVDLLFRWLCLVLLKNRKTLLAAKSRIILFLTTGQVKLTSSPFPVRHNYKLESHQTVLCSCKLWKGNDGHLWALSAMSLLWVCMCVYTRLYTCTCVCLHRCTPVVDGVCPMQASYEQSKQNLDFEVILRASESLSLLSRKTLITTCWNPCCLQLAL